MPPSTHPVPDMLDEGPVTLDACAPRAARSTTILLVGRLVTARGDHLCRVRNVSAGGMMLEADVPLRRHDRVRVELRNMRVAEGEVAWSEPPRAGIRFDAAADVNDLLHATAAVHGYRPRAPRLSAACPVVLWHAGRMVTRHLRDLSQSGCRLTCDTAAPIGSDVRLSIPDLPPRHATLRWIADGEAGYAFNEMLRFADLSIWQRDHGIRFADLAILAGPSGPA